MLKRYDIDSLDNRDEEAIARLYRLLGGLLMRYFRAEVRGLERIPSGAGLYVANHSSALLTPDSFTFGCEVYRVRGIEDCPYGLGHEFAISLPIVHQIIVPLGAVRAGHDTAHRLFERGKKVIVYPGGDVDNMRPYRHRNRIIWDGRAGFARLVIREGVPIIPMITAGSHGTLYIIDDLRWLARLLRLDKPPVRSHVWPLSLSIPWGLTLGPVLAYVPLPVKFLQEVLDPITFPRTGGEASEDRAYVQECAEHVHRTMEQALVRLDAERTGG